MAHLGHMTVLLALHREGSLLALGCFLLLWLLLSDHLSLICYLLLLPLLLQVGHEKQVNCKRRKRGESRKTLGSRGILLRRPLSPISEELLQAFLLV